MSCVAASFAKDDVMKSDLVDLDVQVLHGGEGVMAHPDDYQYYLNCGCEDVSHCLGFQSMPDGYALMLDADRMYFFWMEKATGRGSSIHHDRWAVRRGAISDAARRTGQGGGDEQG